MGVRQDEPFEIQPRANGRMATVLQMATGAALILGLLGAVLPGEPGRYLAWGSFSLVVAAPLARVGWLGVRWIVRRDYLFATLAFSLLLAVAIGGGLAVLARP